MRNARKYNSRVTIGWVPDSEDLEQLRSLGYKTLIDLREEDEKFGGLVQKRTTDMGMRYLAIPISRQGINLEDLTRFYQAVYEKGSAPIYAFSRFGRKPLAFLLLFDGVASREPHLILSIMKKAHAFGTNLEEDLVLREFMVNMLDSGKMGPVVESIRRLRADLFPSEIQAV
jgi:protein tyrosine phosphatase (PTP) superfamily phosphohydrolase (DUF442 family)